MHCKFHVLHPFLTSNINIPFTISFLSVPASPSSLRAIISYNRNSRHPPLEPHGIRRRPRISFYELSLNFEDILYDFGCI